jgi:hypothetical protein
MMKVGTLCAATVITLLVGSQTVNGFHLSIARVRSTRISSELPEKTDTANVAPKAAEALQKWVFNEPLSQIVPRDDISSAVKELQGNGAFWDSNKNLFDKWWLQFENTARSEVRPLKDIVGNQATTELLNAIERADVYDPTTVRAFLQNSAFETMIGGILYEGIFEFIQRVDIIGNIVNGLPIIGPIRQTIMSEFKKNLDRTLGGQVKTFLASFNRVAVQRMIDFILSPNNRLSLQKANRSLVQSLLERPFSSVIPNTETTVMLRDRLWTALRETPTSEAVSIGQRNDAAKLSIVLN